MVTNDNVESLFITGRDSVDRIKKMKVNQGELLKNNALSKLKKKDNKNLQKPHACRLNFLPQSASPVKAFCYYRDRDLLQVYLLKM